MTVACRITAQGSYQNFCHHNLSISKLLAERGMAFGRTVGRMGPGRTVACRITAQGSYQCLSDFVIITFP